MTEPTYQFGWRRFQFEVPEPWEPSHLEGDDAGGYARLDDALRTRLELKWSRSYADDACDVAFRRYLKQLVRPYGKRGGAAVMPHEPKEISLVSRWPDGMRGRTVRWSAEVDGLATIIACSRCNRVTAIQVFFPPGEMQTGLMRRILETFRDHPEDPDGPVGWSLYRMRFQAPARWRLVAHRFGPGYAEMNFRGPDGLLADLRRWGPAEIILKKQNLLDWYLAQFPKGVTVEKKDVTQAEVRGDVVLAVAREPRGLLAILRRRGRVEVAKQGLCLQSVAWHCPAGNRLWMTDVYAPTLPAAQAGDWKVFCHGEAQGA